jgi:F0F1-type ATP synthase delta subunit
MRTKDYITASYKILEKTQDAKAVLTSLKSYLKKRGLEKLYSRVLLGLIEKSERTQKHSGVHVYVAREYDLKKHELEIKKDITTYNLPLEYTTSVDETLVGGYVITTKGARIDRSHKHKLLTAYRALID